MNADIRKLPLEGNESVETVDLTNNPDISMDDLKSVTLPYTRDDITQIDFDGDELTLSFDSGELVLSDFLNEFGEIKEIYTVNGQLLFKDVGDLIAQLGAPAAGNVGAEGSSSVFSFLDDPSLFLEGNGLGYRDLRAGLNNPDISVTDLNGDPDNPFIVPVSEALPDTLVFDEGSFGGEGEKPGGNVLANDSGPQGSTLSVIAVNGEPLDGDSVIIELPSGALVKVFADGAYEVLNPDVYNDLGLGVGDQELETFTYTASDGTFEDSTTVTIVVNGVNDAPDAVNDIASTNEDESVKINVLNNDSDPDGDDLTVTDASAGNGSVVINDDGTLTYTPDENYNGSDTISYSVSDGNGGTDTAEVVVTVTAVNDAPIAVDDEVTTDEDTPVDISVLSNDSDPDGDDLTVTDASAGNGSVVINDDGTLTYTPDENYNGSDTISYSISDGNGGTDTAEVTVTVTAVNDAPIAVDDEVTTDEDTPVDISVLSNDSDPDGDDLTVTDASAGNGSVVINDDGTLTYTPDENYNGSDTISYSISDGNGGTDTAEVAVTVTAVNDAPIAVDDEVTTDEDTPVDISVLSNDSDPDGDDLTVTDASAGNGSVVINDDGTLTYTPDENYNGSDTISYSISDGNGGTDTAEVAVTVTAVNDAPIAVDDEVTTDEDTPVDISVLSNDSDPDGDDLTVISASAGNGSVVINDDGTLTYTPDENYNGSDTISYSISDGNGGTDTAEVAVTVTAVNDAPIAVDDEVTTDEDTPVDISVLSNDSDPDGDDLTVISASAGNGSVVINDDGTLTYTPDENYNGSDTISYSISDGNGGTDTAEVAVTVTAVNDAPIAVDDEVTTDEDTPVDISVLSNDSDPDGDDLTVISASAGNGSVVINDDGTLTYTPDENYNGSDTISYSISDGNGGTDTAEVAVTVTAVNDVPSSSNDEVDTLEDVSIVLGADDFGNFSDADAGDTLQGVKITDLPDEGLLEFTTNGGTNWQVVTENQEFTITQIENGDLRFTPDADEFGDDYAFIDFQVTDGTAYSDSSYTLTVNVIPVPDQDCPTPTEGPPTNGDDVLIFGATGQNLAIDALDGFDILVVNDESLNFDTVRTYDNIERIHLCADGSNQKNSQKVMDLNAGDVLDVTSNGTLILTGDPALPNVNGNLGVGDTIVLDDAEWTQTTTFTHTDGVTYDVYEAVYDGSDPELQAQPNHDQLIGDTAILWIESELVVDI